MFPLNPETVNVKLAPRLIALGLTEQEKLSGWVLSTAFADGQVTFMEAFSALVTFTVGVLVSSFWVKVAVALLLVPVAPVQAHFQSPLGVSDPALQPDTVHVTVASVPFVTSGAFSSTEHSHPVTGLPTTSTFPEQSWTLSPILIFAPKDPIPA